jgi:hypothetical protein
VPGRLYLDVNKNKFRGAIKKHRRCSTGKNVIAWDIVHEARDVTLLFVLVLLDLHGCIVTSLEGLDLLLDTGFALLGSEAVCLVFQRLRLPVLLFGGLERRILTNGSIGLPIDILDIIGTDTVGEVGGELLFKARVDKVQFWGIK